MGAILTKLDLRSLIGRRGVLIGCSLTAAYVIHRFMKHHRDHAAIQAAAVDGTVTKQFQAVKDAFQRNFADGWETHGAALAVFHRGELVVDLWGGYADFDAHRPWKRETMSTLFSTSKLFCALSIAVLVDRGQLDYDEPVCTYWPEFAQNGKDKITVCDLISHMGGLAFIDDDITYEDVADWRRMSAIFERQTPNWYCDRTQFGYHALTIGWLADQLVRRVDPQQRSIGQFIREELCAPHSSELVHIGLPAELDQHVTRVSLCHWRHQLPHMIENVGYAKYAFSYLLGANADMKRVYSNPSFICDGIPQGRYAFNDPSIRRVEIPSVNGIATARAMAAPLNAVLNGKLLSSKTLDRISAPLLTDTVDCLAGETVDVGHGFVYTKSKKDDIWLIGHPGHGGQNAKLDLKHQLVIAYITNECKPSLSRDFTRTFRRLENAIYDCIP